MKHVKKILRDKKNQVLLLGIAVSFLLFSQNRFSISTPFVPPAEQKNLLPSSEGFNLGKGNLLSANFLAAFFSSVISKTAADDLKKTCNKSFTRGESSLVGVFSSAE